MNLTFLLLLFLTFNSSNAAGVNAVIKIARLACEIALNIYSGERPMSDKTFFLENYSNSKLDQTILLDHHFQTHVEFPTEILLESMLNYIQNPSELSKKIFVQDCEKYRPSSILLNLKVMLRKETSNWLLQYFERYDYESKHVQEISIGLVSFLQKLIRPTIQCLLVEETESGKEAERNRTLNLVNEINELIEDHIQYAAYRYYDEENLKAIFELYWPVDCHNDCILETGNKLMMILKSKYFLFNDYYSIIISPLSSNSQSRFYGSKVDSFLSFDLYGYNFIIYRSQRSGKSKKAQNILSSKYNRFLSNECFSLPEHYCHSDISENSVNMAFEKLQPHCEYFEFCEMTTGSEFTVIQDPEEAHLFQDNFTYCDCSNGFTVFRGIHKSKEIGYRGKNILMALRMSWLEFIKKL